MTGEYKLTAKKSSDEKTQDMHFASGMNFYKLFWVFIIGSMLGCLVETIFAYALNGVYECRASLIYGPFNVIYGIGAVTLYIGLSKLKMNRKKSLLSVFIFGSIAGTVVEFLCSWVQEMAWGTLSWDYSNLPLNINGRVSLIFAVFWGLLAVVWVKWANPLLNNAIAKIPNRIGKPITHFLLVFLLMNILLSSAAVNRWTERETGAPASTFSATLLDTFYPDDVMDHNFLDMKNNRDAVGKNGNQRNSQ